MTNASADLLSQLQCYHVSALEDISSNYAAGRVPREWQPHISRCSCLVHIVKRLFQVNFRYTNVFDQARETKCVRTEGLGRYGHGVGTFFRICYWYCTPSWTSKSTSSRESNPCSGSTSRNVANLGGESTSDEISNSDGESHPGGELNSGDGLIVSNESNLRGESNPSDKSIVNSEANLSGESKVDDVSIVSNDLNSIGESSPRGKSVASNESIPDSELLSSTGSTLSSVSTSSSVPTSSRRNPTWRIETFLGQIRKKSSEMLWSSLPPMEQRHRHLI